MVVMVVVAIMFRVRAPGVLSVSVFSGKVRDWTAHLSAARPPSPLLADNKRPFFQTHP